MKTSGSHNDRSPSRLIDARIKELGDWRGQTLSRLRAIIKPIPKSSRSGSGAGFRCGRTTALSAPERLTTVS
jgi:hypothetical protein